MNEFDVIVIGGGAAGMMSAGIAAANGKKVALIEKNPILGKKILISGKGRCNLTNYCDVKELIVNIPTNGKFLTNAFYRFSAYDAIEFFEKSGLPTKVERGNRVFPKSDKALDVVKIMEKMMIQNGVKIFHEQVVKVEKQKETFKVQTVKTEYFAEKVIITTGGKSYPGTGSTGDGYKFAKNFGHKIIPPKPSLVPFEAHFFADLSKKQKTNQNVLVTDLQGLSLRNVAVSVFNPNDKKVYSDFGEMLFTHFGVSGPLILSASAKLKNITDFKLVIDLKPALSEEKLDARILRDFKENQNKKFENILKFLLPAKLIPVIIVLSNIPAKKQVNKITRLERKRLLLLLKNLTIILEKIRPLKEAIVTSGGVDVHEINPKTMESKLVKGLFFAGEIIDVDGVTGGFNLQIAWSSGFAAGTNCSSN